MAAAGAGSAGSAARGGGGSSAASRWFFSREQLENTPSRRCGVEADKELSYRQQAANLIQDMGQRLNVYPSADGREGRRGPRVEGRRETFFLAWEPSPGALPVVRSPGRRSRGMEPWPGGTEWEEEPGEAPAPRSLSALGDAASHLPSQPARAAPWGCSEVNPSCCFTRNGQLLLSRSLM